MSARYKEPELSTLLSFIADHESLTVTCEEFAPLSEQRIREMIQEAAGSSGAPLRKSTARSRKTAGSSGPGRRVLVFTDGAARGNPGPAGAGWVIYGDDENVLDAGCAFLGKRTNNEAEYEAVIHSLRAAQNLGASDVALRSDSELLVRQINGQYRVKASRLSELHQVARDLIQAFRRFDIRHVPREANQAADAQANLAIDGASP